MRGLTLFPSPLVLLLLLRMTQLHNQRLTQLHNQRLTQLLLQHDTLMSHSPPMRLRRLSRMRNGRASGVLFRTNPVQRNARCAELRKGSPPVDATVAHKPEQRVVPPPHPAKLFSHFSDCTVVPLPPVKK
eukprot:Hpha_TRINITY_DN4021_c0_g1::TRINITY_DN4021_c0_g1_i2::g.63844::m.63844